MHKIVSCDKDIENGLKLDLDLGSLAQLTLPQISSSGDNEIEEIAQILPNEDGSIWLENRSDSVSTEILDLENNTSGRLSKGDVAQVRNGQGLSISGNYFKLNIEGSTVSLSSLNSQPTMLKVKKQLL